GLFTPFAIFSNLLFPEKLFEIIGLRDYYNIELYNNILQWNANKEKNLYNLFKNSMFYLELMELFEKESKNAFKSDGLDKTDDNSEIYFNTLLVYFTQSLEKALNKISIKYPYLDIDS